jgi:ribosomal-protein-alanine N-acetyltransferase
VRDNIRWFIKRDMPEVLEIEQSLGEQAWCEEDILHHLRQRDTIGMVYDLGDRLLGYMLYRLAKHSIELVRLVIHPGYRKVGVGANLIQRLVSKLSRHKRTFLGVNVSEQDLAAQLFLKACGLLAVRVIPTEDGAVYRFVYMLPQLLDGDAEVIYANEIGGEG